MPKLHIRSSDNEPLIDAPFVDEAIIYQRSKPPIPQIASPYNEGGQSNSYRIMKPEKKSSLHFKKGIKVALRS